LLSLGVEYFLFQFDIKIFKYYDIQNCNLLCCFYGCETWSVTMRVECRVRVFENRGLRGIFGVKRDGVTVEEIT